MSNKISKRTIERIIETARIEEVVGDYVELKKNGVRYVGLCPFHEDRHVGNFVVYPPRGVYRCFACDARGDAVDFVMRHLKVDFMDAIRIIGKKYSIDTDGQDVAVSIPQRPKPAPLPVLSIPEWMMNHTRHTENDNLVRWVRSLPWDSAQRSRLPKVMDEYHVGHSKTGHTMWWLIDETKTVRTAKMMMYKEDGHRDATGRHSVVWVHSLLFRQKYDGMTEDQWEVQNCLFGLHLLDDYPHAEVHIVESEKTAVVMAIAYGNNYTTLWMACGGKTNLTREKLAPLMRRKRRIVLHPDHDGIEEWQNIAKGLNYDLLTVNAKAVSEGWWKPEDGEKADMADVLVRMMHEKDERVKPVGDLMQRTGVKILVDNLKLEECEND